MPPRGEVNAADAFDIGSFDEDDVKGIKVSTVYSKAACAFEITRLCRLCAQGLNGGMLTGLLDYWSNFFLFLIICFNHVQYFKMKTRFRHS